MKDFSYLFLLTTLILAGCSTQPSPAQQSNIQDTITTGKLTNIAYPSTEGSEAVRVTGHIITYTSHDLGIQFKVFYPLNQADLRPSITRSGDIINVGSQYLTVFNKNPKETLEHAIQRLFLTDKPKQCIITHGVDMKHMYAPNIPGKNTLMIDYPNAGIDHKLEECKELCYPDEFCSEYALGNGFRYFIGDDAHEIFIFVNEGQDGSILGDTETFWADTVQFIK